MTNILFVCTGNQFRSPIAAAYLRQRLEERGVRDWQVESAGTWAIPRLGPSAEAIRDADGLGLDIRDHVSCMVDEEVLRDAGLIITMEKGQKEALLTEFPGCGGRTYVLSELLGGLTFNVPDPVAYPGEHGKVLREMCELIERAFPRIVELAASAWHMAE